MALHIRKPYTAGTNSTGPCLNPQAWCGADVSAVTSSADQPLTLEQAVAASAVSLCGQCLTAVSAALNT